LLTPRTQWATIAEIGDIVVYTLHCIVAVYVVYGDYTT